MNMFRNLQTRAKCKPWYRCGSDSYKKNVSNTCRSSSCKHQQCNKTVRSEILLLYPLGSKTSETVVSWTLFCKFFITLRPYWQWSTITASARVSYGLLLVWIEKFSSLIYCCADFQETSLYSLSSKALL